MTANGDKHHKPLAETLGAFYLDTSLAFQAYNGEDGSPTPAKKWTTPALGFRYTQGKIYPAYSYLKGY